MEDPIVPMDTGLFKNGDIAVGDAVVDENCKVAMVNNGSKLIVVQSLNDNIIFTCFLSSM